MIWLSTIGTVSLCWLRLLSLLRLRHMLETAVASRATPALEVPENGTSVVVSRLASSFVVAIECLLLALAAFAGGAGHAGILCEMLELIATSILWQRQNYWQAYKQQLKYHL